MLDATLERWISELTQADGGASLDHAREVFHQRTGPFDVGERWYEERIRFFFNWFLCDGGGARTWLETYPDADETERRLARACAISGRSLYTVTQAAGGQVRLADRLGGGCFTIDAVGAAERLSKGETFDGRILVIEEGLTLSPRLSRGIIFHPPQAHEALEALLLEIAPVDGDREPVLDSLLRMKMRLDRFTSIRARHIYCTEALDDPSINSAGWARKPS